MSEHSKLPWRVERERTSSGRLEVWAGDERETIVCEVFGSASNPTVAADTALIVKAVNSYHEIQELLNDLHAYLDQRADVDDGQPNTAMHLLSRVEKAMEEGE